MCFTDGAADSGEGIMADLDQLSLAEALFAENVRRNAALKRLSREVKCYRFEKHLACLMPDGTGQPPYEPLLMLKPLSLQRWYCLSDANLEDALNDRVSFRRFLGLSREDAAPDPTTPNRFRNRLTNAQLTEKLFAEFERQLNQRGGPD
jgi:transposase, IS5 family